MESKKKEEKKKKRKRIKKKGKSKENRVVLYVEDSESRSFYIGMYIFWVVVSEAFIFMDLYLRVAM